MGRINIFNSDMIGKRVRDLAILGILGFGLIKLPAACKNLSESRRYNSNIKSVVNYIDEGNFEASKELLGKFKENNILEPADFSKLEVKIGLAEKEFAMKEDDKSIDYQLSQNNIDSGLREIDSVMKSFVKTEDFAGKSLEDALNYILDEFKFNIDSTYLEYHLDNFYKFIKITESDEIRNIDLSNLEDLSNFFITTKVNFYRVSMISSDFGRDSKATGTRVVVKRKNGVNGYSWKDTPNDIPLFSIGTYKRDSKTDDDYHLIKINDKDYWFHAEELALFQDYDEIRSLVRINERVREIMDYCNSVKEGKEEGNGP